MTGILLQVITGDSLTGAAPAIPETSTVKSLSFLDLIIKGGPIMIPIGILSIAALYLFFERLFYINRAARMDQNFMNTIKDSIHRGNIDAASALCKSTNTALSKMVYKGVKRLGAPIQDIERSIESAGKVEISNMEKNVAILGTIAAIAPMFGFLGTIFGVIKIFYNIALADNISIGLIAGGLYEKMITSAAGLLIGIMAYVFHHILLMKIDRTIAKMEAEAVEFIDIIQEPSVA